MKVLFVCGGGIGNLVQATPAINAIAAAGHVVDLKVFPHGTIDIKEILSIPAVRNIYVKDEPKLKYHVQITGPFVRKPQRYRANKYFKSRTAYKRAFPEAKVYYTLAKRIGIKTKMGSPEINIGESGPEPKPGTVVLYPGAKNGWPMKRWDKYDLLSKKFNPVTAACEQKVQ